MGNEESGEGFKAPTSLRDEFLRRENLIPDETNNTEVGENENMFDINNFSDNEMK